MKLSRGRWLLLLYGVSAVAALVAAEAWVRLRSPYGHITPESLRASTLRYSPAVFARHVFPREAVVAHPEAGRKDLRYVINGKGYRGRDFEPKKPDGVIRAIVYGGSAAFDIYVSDPFDWPHRVEKELRDSGLTQVEIVNAGIPGHTSSDSVGRYFAEGHTFQPDIVLLYEGWNDLKFFGSSTPLLRQAAPYVEQEDPRLVYRNAVDRWLGEASQLYVRLRHRYYEYRLRPTVEGARASTQANAVSPEALRQYRLTLEVFVDIARRTGAIPVLMTQARLVRTDNTAEEKDRIGYEIQPLAAVALPAAFQHLDATIVDVATVNRVDWIDAGAAVASSSDFVDHVHLSDAGSVRLSRVTAAALRPIVERVLRERAVVARNNVTSRPRE